MLPEARKVETDDIRQVAGVGAEPVQPVASDAVKDPTVPVRQVHLEVVAHFAIFPRVLNCLGFPPLLAVTKWPPLGRSYWPPLGRSYWPPLGSFPLAASTQPKGRPRA